MLNKIFYHKMHITTAGIAEEPDAVQQEVVDQPPPNKDGSLLLSDIDILLGQVAPEEDSQKGNVIIFYL